MVRVLRKGLLMCAFLAASTLLFGLGMARAQDTADPSCHVTLPASQAAIPSGGAVKRVDFPADQWNCVTSSQSKVDWVSVSVVPPGSNEAPVFQYAVQPNLSSHSRAGSIVVGDQVLAIAQEAGPQPGIAGPSRLAWVVRQNDKPEKKNLRVGSDDPELDFTAAPSARATPWLSVKKNGEDSRSFEIVVDVSKLRAGTYAGEIVVHAAGARNDPLSIPVHIKLLP
jgi:hypothetical protein